MSSRPLAASEAVAGEAAKHFVAIEGETTGGEGRVDFEKAQLDMPPVVPNPDSRPDPNLDAAPQPADTSAFQGMGDGHHHSPRRSDFDCIVGLLWIDQTEEGGTAAGSLKPGHLASHIPDRERLPPLLRRACSAIRRRSGWLRPRRVIPPSVIFLRSRAASSSSDVISPDSSTNSRIVRPVAAASFTIRAPLS